MNKIVRRICIAVCGFLVGIVIGWMIISAWKMSQAGKDSMFVTVEETSYWRVVYQQDTKVMYAVGGGKGARGTFTVMLNPDGTPQLWED